MPTTQYDFVAGDTGSTLIVELKNKQTKEPIDLTNRTARLKFKIDSGAVETRLMAIDSPATSGVVRYTFQTGELVAGKMQSVVTITETSTSAVVTTLDPMIHLIRENL